MSSLPELSVPLNPTNPRRRAYSNPFFYPDEWEETWTGDSYKYRASENQLGLIDSLVTKALEEAKRAEQLLKDKKSKEEAFFRGLTSDAPRQFEDDDGEMVKEDANDIRVRKSRELDEFLEKINFEDAAGTQELYTNIMMEFAKIQVELEWLKENTIKAIKEQDSDFARYYKRKKTESGVQGTSASMVDDVVNKLRLDK